MAVTGRRCATACIGSAGRRPLAAVEPKGNDMDCKQEKNLAGCNCTYEPCSRKGICCDCIRYHLKSRQLPACCFNDAAERTYDRSFEHFARLVAEKKV